MTNKKFGADWFKKPGPAKKAATTGAKTPSAATPSADSYGGSDKLNHPTAGRHVRVLKVPQGSRVRVIPIARRPAPTAPGRTAPPRHVVVRRRKKDSKKMALLAAAALALAGGGTYTLWYSSQQIDGGQVTAGELDMTSERITWYDVSADRTDDDAESAGKLNDLTGDLGFYNEFNNLLADPGAPHAGRSAFTKVHRIECIDQKGVDFANASCAGRETWKIVPGDTIVGLITANIRLEGDNLVAGLEFECDDPLPAPLPPEPEYGRELTSGNIADLVTVKTDVYVSTAAAHDSSTASLPGRVLTHLDPLPGASGEKHLPFLGYFEAPGFGQDRGVLDAAWEKPLGTPGQPIVTTLGKSLAPDTRDSLGEGDVTLMITIHFSENATDRQLATLPLAEVFSGRLALSQVRGIDTPGQFIQSAP